MVRRSRAAPADQGPLRPRGHRDPVPPAGGLAPRGAAPAGRARAPPEGKSTFRLDQASGERRLERDRRAAECLADRAAHLGGLGGRDESIVVDALDHAAHGQLDAGDAGAGGEFDRGASSPAWSPACPPWPARWTAPSRNTTNGRRRSAPRGWSCRWPPRRARARTRRTSRCRRTRGSPCRSLRRGFPPSAWWRSRGCHVLITPRQTSHQLQRRESCTPVRAPFCIGMMDPGTDEPPSTTRSVASRRSGASSRRSMRASPRTRSSDRSTPRRTSVPPRSAFCSSSCSTGADPRPTPTRAAIRGCGCGTRPSRSPRRPRTAG